MAMQQIEVLLAGVRDTSGQPLAAGKVYTYEPGTTTPKATYQDSAGATPHSNPIVLDAYGRALVYADGSFKLKVDNSADVNQYTWDNLFFSRVTAQTSQWPDIYGGTSGGSASAYTVTVPLSLTTYNAGQQFTFLANHSNTGATTVNVNGLGAKSVVKWSQSGYAALAAGDIPINQLVSLLYDSGSGGRFVLVKPGVKQLLKSYFLQIDDGGTPDSVAGTMSIRTGAQQTGVVVPVGGEVVVQVQINASATNANDSTDFKLTKGTTTDISLTYTRVHATGSVVGNTDVVTLAARYGPVTTAETTTFEAQWRHLAAANSYSRRTDMLIQVFGPA